MGRGKMGLASVGDWLERCGIFPRVYLVNCGNICKEFGHVGSEGCSD